MDIADVSRVPADVLRNVEADTYWCMSRLLDGIQVSQAAGALPQAHVAPRAVRREGPRVVHREGSVGEGRTAGLGLGRVWTLQSVPQVQRVRQPLQREPVERFMLHRPAPWALGTLQNQLRRGSLGQPRPHLHLGWKGVQGLLWCWGRCRQAAPGPDWACWCSQHGGSSVPGAQRGRRG